MDYFKEAVRVQGKERSWVTYIKAKVFEQNQCFPCLVVGQTGSGKSWSTLRLCQEIDPDFKLEGNWFFRAEEFYRAYKAYYAEDNYKKGKIWVLDEAGVDFSSDSWQSKLNKIFAQVFSTARFRNYIFFGTVPFTDFISKKIRQLMQYRMTANYIITKNKVTKGVIIPRCLQWSDTKQDFYYHRLIKINEDGTELDVNRMLLNKPTMKLITEYENKKREFSKNLDDELLQQIDDNPNNKQLKPTQLKLIQFHKDGYIQKEMSKLLNIASHGVTIAIKNLRKKGWDFSYNKNEVGIYNPDTKVWELYPKRKV